MTHRTIIAAGGIVKNEKGQFLIIYRLGQWDFPKGKVEENESLESAALREVQEETGVNNLTLISAITQTTHYYILNNEKICKITHWFEMSCLSSISLVPQKEEDIQQVIWVSKEEVTAKLNSSYETLKELWQFFLETKELPENT